MHYASSLHASLPAEVVQRSEILSRFSPEFLRKPERLHFHLLIHCTEREGHHWVDFERVPLRPRNLVYIAPGQVHQYDRTTDFESRMLVVPAIKQLSPLPSPRCAHTTTLPAGTTPGQ